MKQNGNPTPALNTIEQVWQFAGQELRPSDFNTAMVHFYRGELSRSNTWRNRLDATTNWAVVTTGAALSFAFSGRDNPAVVIIVDTILVLLFLLIEARRYRYYELWTSRVRLMETNFFASLLTPPFHPQADWAEKVAESLHNPAFTISLGEAFGRRYRRNYAPIFLILAMGWLFKIALHPEMSSDWAVLLQRASVGPIPGWVMVLIGVIFHIVLLVVGIVTVGWRESQGEVFDKQSTSWLHRITNLLHRATWEALEIDLPSLPLPRPGQHRPELVFIISDQGEAIGQQVMEKTKRGLTALEGKGMYTGQPHSILMCACNAAQAQQIKQIVHRVDPAGFVVITDARDIRGRGFRPLET